MAVMGSYWYMKVLLSHEGFQEQFPRGACDIYHHFPSQHTIYQEPISESKACGGNAIQVTNNEQ